MTKPILTPDDIIADARTRAAKRKQAPAPAPDHEAIRDIDDRFVGLKPSLNHTPDGVSISGVPMSGPILMPNDNLAPLLEYFGLNPEFFEVKDETFRSWNQSARTKDGDRDVVWLYSAAFRRIDTSASPSLAPDVFDDWCRAIVADLPNLPALPEPTGATYKLKVADPQWGKKGTAQARDNFQRATLAHLAQVQRLIDSGVGITNLHLAWLGDETEGVCNNYANQPHTVELNLARQIHLHYTMMVWQIRQAMRLGLNLSVSSVPSNHGEWTRNGGKDPVTGRSDNESTTIARLVQEHFADATEHHGAPAIEWYIADDGNPYALYTLSGVKQYDTHGYVEKGKGNGVEARMLSAIREQIAGQPDLFGDVQIADTAHNHHMWKMTDGRITVFGNPSLEAEKSSEWYLHSRAKWNQDGSHGMVVSNEYATGYAHENVF